jgi:hypothetical protein
MVQVPGPTGVTVKVTDFRESFGSLTAGAEAGFTVATVTSELTAEMFPEYCVLATNVFELPGPTAVKVRVVGETDTPLFPSEGLAVAGDDGTLGTADVDPLHETSPSVSEHSAATARIRCVK